eukprot:EG_transcript_41518
MRIVPLLLLSILTTAAEDLVTYEGSCSFAVGAVKKALRGKTLAECTELFKEARKADPGVNGLEASLDNRQLCWLIAGVRGLKKLNPKLQCVVAQGTAAPAAPANAAPVNPKPEPAAKHQPPEAAARNPTE